VPVDTDALAIPLIPSVQNALAGVESRPGGAMNKPLLGVVVGAILGLLDGLSAWFVPEARPILLEIVVGSTVKGILTGLVAGFIANWKQSTTLGIVAGVAIGFVLSSLASLPYPDNYWDIVLPGMLVGAIVGFVTQRYPRASLRRSAMLALPLVMATTMPVVAQQSAPADPLTPIASLIGRWTGTSEGQPGKGTVERSYERALGSRFIRVRNRSTYPPQEKNPKGEVHEDEGFFSFDRARKRMLFRQFHVEGLVTTYVHDLDVKPGTLTFTSEAIENIPAGWRARETYILHGPDDLEEIFELAEQGKEFTVYSRTRLKRGR
jgi:hypothetical protein